jgi:hypothetical protein
LRTADESESEIEELGVSWIGIGRKYAVADESRAGLRCWGERVFGFVEKKFGNLTHKWAFNSRCCSESGQGVRSAKVSSS